MTVDTFHDAEERSLRAHDVEPEVCSIEEPYLADRYNSVPLGSQVLRRWANSSVRQSTLLNMQRTHGNRVVQRALSTNSTSHRLYSSTLSEQPPSKPPQELGGSGAQSVPIQRLRLPSFVEDAGEYLWNSRHNPIKKPVDRVRNFFGGDSGPTQSQVISDIMQKHQRDMMLLRNKEQIEKQYGSGLYSVMQAGLMPVLPAIEAMDQQNQEQAHSRAINSAQMALTGALPGAPTAEQPPLYEDMVSSVP